MIRDFGLLLAVGMCGQGFMMGPGVARNVTSLIVDGKPSAVPAMISSVRTVLDQPAVMLLWASVVALLTLVGFATFFIGLAIVFPILGYATWHSYRDLMG